MARVVKAPIVEYLDASGNTHTAQAGQTIEPSTTSEARLEALGMLAPAGHTATQAEEEVTKRSAEWEASKNGTGPRPTWEPGVVAAAEA